MAAGLQGQARLALSPGPPALLSLRLSGLSRPPSSGETGQRLLLSLGTPGTVGWMSSLSRGHPVQPGCLAPSLGSNLDASATHAHV